MSTVMEGNEFTLMFLLVSEVLMPLMLVMILVAVAKLEPPLVDLANPIAVSSDGHES